MKTKKYIKDMESLNFIGKVEETRRYVCVKNKNGDDLMLVDKLAIFSVAVDQKHFEGLTGDNKAVLINLTILYAKTPPEERKEEKRYYARSKFTATGDNYLNLFDSGNTDLITKFAPQGVQTKFTIEELKGLGIQFDENNEPYEWILEEVTE
ncbi:hypothetical protein [Abyssicoccus albus]|uniref:Uncharacterized protein n=1 Tax=Abyssicoccus albus TaxID=1817405 RepID=A0A3N5CCT0_9BACL|nr:hypothetical protein [Abyssicoccus albus]RPF54791.1 hypothetical protein EDD62_1752 [Abyssicoccus albus]